VHGLRRRTTAAARLALGRTGSGAAAARPALTAAARTSPRTRPARCRTTTALATLLALLLSGRCDDRRLAVRGTLADQGVAVIIISHNLQDVFKVADYINVLYLGTMVASIPTDQTTSDDVVGYITGSKTYDGASA